MISPRDWNAGDSNRSRAHLQEPVDAIRELQRAAFGQAGGLADGTVNPVEIGLAKVVNAGPNGATDDPDFTDARYWLQRLLILFGDADDPVQVDVDTTDQISYQSPPNIFVATNWPERQTGTHALLTDGTVEVMYLAFWDAGSPQQKHYVFYTVPDPTFIVGIYGPPTSASISADAGAYYDGYCYKTFPVSINPATDTLCLIRDDSAIYPFGTSARWATGWGIGRFCGEYTTDTPPRMIIHATGFGAQTASTHVPGIAIPNAGTQVWNRDQPYLPATSVCGDVAPTLDIAVRGGKFRRFSFDASGRVTKIEAETT